MAAIRRARHAPQLCRHLPQTRRARFNHSLRLATVNDLLTGKTAEGVAEPVH